MIMIEQAPVILVTGSNGQLGLELQNIASDYPDYRFIFTSVNDLDITSDHKVFSFFRDHEPKICVNCAAYTHVDKAEEESEKAFLVNSSAVKNLALACKLHGSKLIHLSTDYVYDSIIDQPILESDPKTPRSIYGRSKRTGEEVLEHSDIDWICIRTSWLYSRYRHNFVKTMHRLGKEKSELRVVADQVGAPTYTLDLARAIMSIIKADKGYQSHYNFSNSDKTNWAEFARKIILTCGHDCSIIDTTTADYGAPAPRPLWSVMSLEKIRSTYNIVIRSWEAALVDCLKELT